MADTRTNKAPTRLRQLQQAHAEAGLSAESWKGFLLDFAGDVDGILTAAITATDGHIRALSGPAAGEAVVPAGSPPSATSLLPDGAALDKLTLSLLDKEVARLRALIGIDAENAKAFARLSEKISRDEAALTKLDRDIETGHRNRQSGRGTDQGADPVPPQQLCRGVRRHHRRREGAGSPV